MSSTAAATKNPLIVNPPAPPVAQSTTSTLSISSAKGTKPQVLKFMVAEALPSISKRWFDFGHIIIPTDQTGQLETIDAGNDKPIPKTLKMFKLLQESVSEINFEKFFNDVDAFAQLYDHILLSNPQQNLEEIKNNQQWPFVDNGPRLKAAFLDNEVIPQLAEKWQIIGYLLLPENWGQVDAIGNDKNRNEDRLSAIFEKASEMGKPITYSTLKNLFNCTSIGKGALFEKIPFPDGCLPTPPKQKDVQKVAAKQLATSAHTQQESSTTPYSSSTARTHPQQAQSEVSLQQNIQELQTQLDEMKRQLHESQKKSKSSESKSAVLQEQLENIKRQLLESQEKNKSSDSKNVELQSQLESTKNQQQITQNKMQALKDENITLQTENRTLKYQYDNTLKNKAGSMGDTLKNALDTCKKREAEKKELQMRIDALNAELQKASQSKGAPKVPEYIRKSMTKQQQDIEKLKQEQVDNQEKIASLNQENEKFKVDSFAQQIKAKKLQRELDAKTNENQELTKNLRTLLTDVYKSKNNNAELKNEIEKLNNEIAKLTHEVKIVKHRNSQAAKHRGLDPQHDAIKSPALVSTPDVMSCLFEKHRKFSAKMAGHLVSLKGKLGNLSKTELEKESKLAKLQEEVLRQLDTIQNLTLEYDSEVIIQQSLLNDTEKRASEIAQENLELSAKLDDERALVNVLNGLNNDLEKELKQVREKLFEKEAMIIQLKT